MRNEDLELAPLTFVHPFKGQAHFQFAIRTWGGHTWLVRGGTTII